MTKDYYIVLGVDADATPEQIKSAYRQKVKQLHPDYYGDDQEPFLDVQQAYEVLSDPDRRHAYDQDEAQTCEIPIHTRDPWPPQPQPGHIDYGAEPLRSHKRAVNASAVQPEPLRARAPTSASSPITDSFTGLLEALWGRRERNPRAGSSPSSSRSQLEVDARLTRAQAMRGGHIHAQLPLWMACPACWGEGYWGNYLCQQCGGSGSVTQHTRVSLPFPAGIADGTILRYSLAQLGIPSAALVVHFRVM